jgi:hypothetical protein
MRQIRVAHFPGRLDPAPVLLHRHRDLPIMHIQAQLQDPIDAVDRTGFACYYYRILIRFFHRADNHGFGLSAILADQDGRPSACQTP